VGKRFATRIRLDRDLDWFSDDAGRVFHKLLLRQGRLFARAFVPRQPWELEKTRRIAFLHGLAVHVHQTPEASGDQPQTQEDHIRLTPHIAALELDREAVRARLERLDAPVVEDCGCRRPSSYVLRARDLD
jgi:hypothetical protein